MEDKYLVNFPSKSAKLLFERILKTEGWKSISTQVEKFLPKGQQFIGKIFKITCLKENGVVIKFILKVASKIETERFHTRTKECFANEQLAYEELLPLYGSLQVSLNIPFTHRLLHPRCYGIDTATVLEESIILEDLETRDFHMCNREVSCSYDQMNAALMELAKFHALSFALKHKFPEVYSTIVRNIRNVISLHANEPRFLAYLQYVARANEYLQQMVTRLAAALAVVGTDADLNPFAAICHGDFSTNNLLFHNKDGKTTLAVIIDYQMLSHTSPVCDLMYLIFTATDQVFRDLHYVDLLDNYYKHFDCFVSQLSYKSEQVYPRHVFETDFKKYSLYALGKILLYLSVILCNEDSLVDITRVINESVLRDGRFSKGDRKFHKKMQEVISDFNRLGFL